jgi:hypothetical protein
MPRYFFHLEDEAAAADEEGEVFPTPAAAIRHAWQVQRELTRHTFGSTGVIVVSDEVGREIFRTAMEKEDELC